MRFFKRLKKNQTYPKDINESPDKEQTEKINSSLQENEKKIKLHMGNSSDVISRLFHLGVNKEYHAALFYIEGLVNNEWVHDVLETLLLSSKESVVERALNEDKEPLLALKNSVITQGDIVEITDFTCLYQYLLSGYSILLLDGSSLCLGIGISSSTERGVTEPSSQTVLRGPKEGFAESIGVNISLIRKKIRDPRLWIESKKMGEVTKTNVSIIYLKHLVDEKIVQEVQHRLNQINLPSILEGGMIEEAIQEKGYTPFPTIFNTERPDVVAGGILEGRVAILVDGTPFVLVVPALFSQFYHSAEDYYQRADFATLIRFLRYIALVIALLGPALFIAITTFHQEMIPYPLLISLAAQHEGVPFPTFIESVLLLITFEILREAGIRMPRAVGQAVSIVGAIVVGQAAVEAGIVSAAVVIVIASTAIASFALPANNMEVSIRILRFLLMMLSAAFGLFGIIMGMIALILHLCSLKSFGVPYMTPFAPFILSGQKDAILRFSWKRKKGEN